MKSGTFKFIGSRFVHKAAANHQSKLASLDPRRGFKMMMDLDVSVSRKFVALLSGIAIAALLIFMEIPLAIPLAAIPGVGLILDLLVDGSEALFGPMVIACMLLPLMVGPMVLAKYAADEPLAAIDPDIPHLPIDRS